MGSAYYCWQARDCIAATARFFRHVSEQGNQFDLLAFYRHLKEEDPLFVHLNTVISQEVAILPIAQPLTDSVRLLSLLS